MIEVVRRLTIAEQREILDACQAVIEQAPLFRKIMPTGAKFRYLCTSAGQYGWISDRQGYRYASQHPVTKQNFPLMPPIIRDIAIDAAARAGLSLRPESALINWYDRKGTLGLHQDKTEKSLAPVVSISIGDDCVFIVGGLERTDPKRNMILKSGDVLVMGAEHRLIFHGVKKILPGTRPPELDFKEDGRLNITVRQVYG
jgi:alkylated DNA repair protein (DNA oxidative demethylase)